MTIFKIKIFFKYDTVAALNRLKHLSFDEFIQCNMRRPDDCRVICRNMLVIVIT